MWSWISSLGRRPSFEDPLLVVDIIVIINKCIGGLVVQTLLLNDLHFLGDPLIMVCFRILLEFSC